ncbi:MAG: hypothetical protein Q7T51_03135 [Candidatus Moranbacteria bacterium]|nr:hypothetical protein [Candidatus Moranbacteria bacterium]
MISNLRKIVSAVAEQRGLKVESYKMDDLKLAEMHLDKSGDVDAAMNELKGILDYKWKEKAFPEIEEQLKKK